MTYRAYRSTTSNLSWLHLERAEVAASRPAVGLRWDSPGARAHVLSEAGSRPVPLPLVAGTLGSHRPGGFVEVDADRMPGLYQFGLPDALTADRSALVQLAFDGVRPWLLRVEAVAYDPSDGHGLALDGFLSAVRHDHLTSVFRRVMPPAVIPIVEVQMSALKEAPNDAS